MTAGGSLLSSDSFCQGSVPDGCLSDGTADNAAAGYRAAVSARLVEPLTGTELTVLERSLCRRQITGNLDLRREI
jgi:hypothetical protein